MITDILKKQIAQSLEDLYQIQDASVVIEKTSADFKGDYTFVVFPYLKATRKGPEQSAQEIGKHILENTSVLAGFNVIKGFLNLELKDSFYVDFLVREAKNNAYGQFPSNGKKVLVEYSSPNTNKPLHLGHIRNNLLGYSVYRILQKNGFEVKTCNLINDRGIHICKSMLAWVKAGMQETPENTGIKGDHLVGKYYVAFDQILKTQRNELIAKGYSEEDAEKNAPILLEAQDMLRKWEAGDPETMRIWKTMNTWVYAGFEQTYQTMGVHFDQYYYESDMYLLGKDMVQQGLNQGVFYKKDDGSVWIDLTHDGADQKLLLRGDGTSVYITQDIGTADLKYKEFPFDQSIYVVGNEQDYHFKVLKLILSKLQQPYADKIYHLSYGMVELPHGKMKSREGTVVDADDLMQEMFDTAHETTLALGKTEGLNEADLRGLNKTIGLGALKYFLLKVDPRKKMLFNPADSIDFHGNTGPFIQYTHARIKSVIRNAGETYMQHVNDINSSVELNTFEREIIRLAYQYPFVLQEAAKDLSPGVICNYAFEMAKAYNQFYHECPILKESNEDKKKLRLLICTMTASILKSAFELVGIDVPERM